MHGRPLTNDAPKHQINKIEIFKILADKVTSGGAE